MYQQDIEVILLMSKTPCLSMLKKWKIYRGPRIRSGSVPKSKWLVLGWRSIIPQSLVHTVNDPDVDQRYPADTLPPQHRGKYLEIIIIFWIAKLLLVPSVYKVPSRQSICSYCITYGVSLCSWIFFRPVASLLMTWVIFLWFWTFHGLGIGVSRGAKKKGTQSSW